MARTLEPNAPARPSKFAHFVLRVRDLDRSIAWYEEVVGMEVVQRVGKLAFLTYDDEHHRLALGETPVESEATPGAPGLDHVAYTLADLGALLSTYRRLEAKGYRPILTINHGPTTSLYYTDPDGNGVEFMIDNFDSVELLQGWMQSDEFQANPIGVTFDPEKLVARYEAGDPIEELLKQGAA